MRDVKKQAANKAAWFKAKVALGLCGACGKNPLHTKRLCKDCQAKANAYSQMRRDVNRDFGQPDTNY